MRCRRYSGWSDPARQIPVSPPVRLNKSCLISSAVTLHYQGPPQQSIQSMVIDICANSLVLIAASGGVPGLGPAAVGAAHQLAARGGDGGGVGRGQPLHHLIHLRIDLVKEY